MSKEEKNQDSDLETLDRATFIDAETDRIFAHYDKANELDELPNILGHALARLWAELGWGRDELLDFVDENFCGCAGIDRDLDDVSLDVDITVDRLEAN